MEIKEITIESKIDVDDILESMDEQDRECFFWHFLEEKYKWSEPGIDTNELLLEIVSDFNFDPYEIEGFCRYFLKKYIDKNGEYIENA